MPPAETPARPRVPRRVLGPYLRDLRQQAGLTVKQAAQLMELVESIVARMLNTLTVANGGMLFPSFVMAVSG